MNKLKPLGITKEQIDSSAERRARSINAPKIEQNREILDKISNLMFILDFFKMSPEKITSSPEYMDEVTDLQALINEVKQALSLIKNTLYANLSTSEEGIIDRTDLNISKLSGNIEQAVAHLLENVKSNTLSKIKTTHQAEHPLPPSINGLNSKDRQRLRRVLEEFRIFLHNFMARNKIDVLHKTTKTAHELDSTQDKLRILQKRKVVEEAFDQNFSKRMDLDWKDTLAKLSLTLNTFEGELQGIYHHNAEKLMTMTDESTVAERIESDAKQEGKLNKKINKKDAITSFMPVRFAISAYSYLTGKKMLPWSSPERKTRDALSARIKKYHNYIQKRRRILQKRNSDE